MNPVEEAPMKIAIFALCCCAPISHPIDAAQPVDGTVDAARDASLDSAMSDGQSPDAPAPDAVSGVDATPPSDGPTHVVGSFALNVNTTNGPTNCSPAGARIDTMQIALFVNAGPCVVTTVRVETFGEVALRCNGTPAVIQCIEPADRIIGSDLPLGAYHLIVDGIRNGHVCWSGDASIGIQEGVPSEQALTLLPQPGLCGDVP